MYFHSQNLKKEDRTKDWIHWRCWLGQDTQLTFCIIIPSRFWHVDIDLCQNGWQEEAIGFSIACPLFAIWIGFENKWLYRILEPITKRKGQKYTNGRSIGLSYHSDTIWINLWDDPMESRGVDPWWWSFSFNWKDFILGRRKCTTEMLKEGSVKIDMPEGDYDATYKVEKWIWKRPRWPFAKVREDISFKFPIGVPHEGKGENSWDMGMDATMGTGVEWKGSLRTAIEELTINLIKGRLRYGPLTSPEYAKWRSEGLNRIKNSPTTGEKGEM